MNWVAGLLLAAASAGAYAQTYECMSRTNPGTVYLSYGTPCPSGTAAKDRTQTVLRANAQGQYFTTALINGVQLTAFIDTGATNVSLSRDDAARLGIDLSRAQRGTAQTANGPAPVYFVTLTSVQVGEAALYNVPGTVLEASTSQKSPVLIGMSFLRHFEIEHARGTLTLRRP